MEIDSHIDQRNVSYITAHVKVLVRKEPVRRIEKSIVC